MTTRATGAGPNSLNLVDRLRLWAQENGHSPDALRRNPALLEEAQAALEIRNTSVLKGAVRELYRTQWRPSTQERTSAALSGASSHPASAPQRFTGFDPPAQVPSWRAGRPPMRQLLRLPPQESASTLFTYAMNGLTHLKTVPASQREELSRDITSDFQAAVSQVSGLQTREAKKSLLQSFLASVESQLSGVTETDGGWNLLWNARSMVQARLDVLDPG